MSWALKLGILTILNGELWLFIKSMTKVKSKSSEYRLYIYKVYVLLLQIRNLSKILTRFQQERAHGPEGERLLSPLARLIYSLIGY